nr:FCD domain-containing protein [Leucobacter weissii]
MQQLRGALETEAVRLLRDRHGSRWPERITERISAALDRLGAAEDAGEWGRTLRAHGAVHQAIVDAAESPRIAEEYARLDGETMLMLSEIRIEYPRGSLVAEHRAYAQALIDEGEGLVRTHLAHSTELIRAARAEDARPRPQPGPDPSP